jgi:hypothetical protein
MIKEEFMTSIQSEIIQSINSTNALNNKSERSEKVDALESSAIINGDSVDISDEGKRVSRAMQQMGKIPPPPMIENIDSIQNAIESLDLDSANIEEMSDEALTETVTSINTFLKNIDSENTVKVEALSTDEKVEFISTFKEDSETVMNTLDQMKGMMGGRPPIGGKPPKGAKPPKKSEGIEAYENLTTEDRDEEELRMIEKILETLEESDAEDEELSNMDGLYSVITDYLTSEI